MLQGVFGGDQLRTALALDDDLVKEAQRLSGTIEKKTALVRQALRALTERERARRLAWLGVANPT